jgi:hypothetical protein
MIRASDVAVLNFGARGTLVLELKNIYSTSEATFKFLVTA